MGKTTIDERIFEPIAPQLKQFWDEWFEFHDRLDRIDYFIAKYLGDKPRLTEHG